MFNNMGAAKHMTERLQQYPSAPYTQEAYNPNYMYEPPPPAQYSPSPPITPKHGHHGGHKNNAAMSALTLLAFLFFLNILQQCLKDHMTSTNTAPIMIMTGGKEGELTLAKTTEDVKKVDKTGQLEKPVNSKAAEYKQKPAKIGSVTSKDDKLKEDNFMKIRLEHREKPRDDSGFPGFINAMKMD